jgi:hypothetical protein
MQKIFSSFDVNKDPNISFFRESTYRQSIKSIQRRITPLQPDIVMIEMKGELDLQKQDMNRLFVFRLKKFNKVSIVVSKVRYIDTYDEYFTPTNLITQLNKKYRFESSSCTETMEACLSNIDPEYINQKNKLFSIDFPKKDKWLDLKEKLLESGKIFIFRYSKEDRFKRVYNFLGITGDTYIEGNRVKINDYLAYSYLRAQYINFFGINPDNPDDPYTAKELTIALPTRENIDDKTLDILTLHLIFSILTFLNIKGPDIEKLRSKEEKKNELKAVYRILFSDERELKIFLSNLQELSRQGEAEVTPYRLATEEERRQKLSRFFSDSPEKISPEETSSSRVTRK